METEGDTMGYDLSALVYVLIAVILLVKFYGNSGGGSCS